MHAHIWWSEGRHTLNATSILTKLLRHRDPLPEKNVLTMRPRSSVWLTSWLCSGKRSQHSARSACCGKKPHLRVLFARNRLNTPSLQRCTVFIRICSDECARMRVAGATRTRRPESSPQKICWVAPDATPMLWYRCSATTQASTW